MFSGPSTNSMPSAASALLSMILKTPVLGASKSVHPRAKSTPGIAIGMRIRVQAKLRSGISVRSMSQAKSIASTRVSEVPIAEMTIVVPSAR